MIGLFKLFLVIPVILLLIILIAVLANFFFISLEDALENYMNAKRYWIKFKKILSKNDNNTCNGCRYEDLRGFEPHCRGCVRLSDADNYEEAK